MNIKGCIILDDNRLTKKMKKLLFTLAVLLMSGAAFAQNDSTAIGRKKEHMGSRYYLCYYNEQLYF